VCANNRELFLNRRMSKIILLMNVLGVYVGLRLYILVCLHVIFVLSVLHISGKTRGARLCKWFLFHCLLVERSILNLCVNNTYL